MKGRGSVTRIKLQQGRPLVKRGEMGTVETCIRGLQGSPQSFKNETAVRRRGPAAGEAKMSSLLQRPRRG